MKCGIIQRPAIGPPSSMRDVKEFIRESTKNQTLCANFRASPRLSVAGLSSSARLERFVKSVLCVQEELSELSLTQMNCDARRVISVKEKIMEISNKFHTCNEVHFSVVWVLYYVYETCRAETMPLFKVYKTKFSDDAVFLDPELNAYPTWELFLDKPMVPQSFLCVPRNGTYVYLNEGKVLDLIFVYSKGVQMLHLPSRKNQNLFDRYIRPLFSKLKNLPRIVINNIKRLGVVWEYLWQKRGCILPALIVIIIIFVTLYSGLNSQLISSAFKAVSHYFMLGGWCEEKGLENSPVKAVEHIKQLWGEKNLGGTFSNLAKYYGVNLGSFFNLASPFSETVLTMIDLIVKAVRAIRCLWPKPQPLPWDPDSLGSNKSVPNDAILPNPLEKSTTLNAKNEAKIKAIHNVVENLTNLEITSFEAIIEDALERVELNKGGEYLSPMIEVYSDAENEVFLFPEPSPPRLREEFMKIFDDFAYKKLSEAEFNLIDSRGAVLASLFLVDQDVAIVWIPK